VELGFNLSKPFENYLKHLITQFSTGNSVNNFESTENKLRIKGLPELTALERVSLVIISLLGATVKAASASASKRAALTS
jgi:hypothetical protein